MAGGRAPRVRDFQPALAQRPCARSEHFVLHHLSPAVAAGVQDLSTSELPPPAPGVDEPQRFGQAVPKRHARRAVTRSLIKRQGRAAFQRHAPRLGSGDWLLRLRAPFARERFPSAASIALSVAVRAELEQLFAKVAAR